MKSFFRCALIALVAIAAADAPGQSYRSEAYLPGSGMHGIHGIAFDSEDRLYVGSVVGSTIFEVHKETGGQREFIGPPLGMADDLEFGEDGTLFWTSFILGKVHARKNFGPTNELASGLPGINSLAFKQDGRLFATQVFLGDALYEIDPLGEEPPRKIMENMGGLNGFDFGPDGHLYGPLWFKGQVVKVNVDTAELEVVMDGFKVPAAVNFDSQGYLWVVDSAQGHIVKIDLEEDRRYVYPGMPTAIDNLAFDSQDRLWFTVMAENGVYRFDEETRSAEAVRRDSFAQPTDVHYVHDGDRGLLYVSGMFALKVVELKTGEVIDIARNVASDIEYPNGLFVTDSKIYLTSWFNNTVQIVDRETGEFVATYHGIAGAYDVIESDDGTVYVVTVSGRILTVTGDDPADWEALEARVPGAANMAYAGGNTAYLSSVTNGEVYALDLANGTLKSIATGLDQPEGLALGPDNSLFVLEAGAGAVSRIDPESGVVTRLSGAVVPSGMTLPPLLPKQGAMSGIAVAGDGAIYAVSDKEGGIYRIVENTD